MTGWDNNDHTASAGMAQDGYVDEFAAGGGGGDEAHNDENVGFGENSALGAANGDGLGESAGPADDSCRNCGAADHFARECPEPRKSLGDCFNCGEPGHSRAECTKPRVFKGVCKVCNAEGHPASECPDRSCINCKQTGHSANTCTENRIFERSRIPDKTQGEALADLKKASDVRDLDDFRQAVSVYVKAAPLITYAGLEKLFRDNNFNVYLIGLAKDESKVHSVINLQGKLDCEYVVGYYLSAKPNRDSLIDRWPSSAEENIERLANAGLPLDRGVPKCNICDELGHTARGCTEEKPEIERPEVKCANCSEAGHRVRDCPVPRKDKFACRNCGQSGHAAVDCSEPRSAEGVECRKCGETGHFSKDCPTAEKRTCRNCGSEEHMAKECDKPRDPSTVTCRNCDATGHFSKDCPKPRDWSRVKCPNCGEMGHGFKKCKQPIKEEGGGIKNSSNFGNSAGDFDNAANGGDFGGSAGYDNAGGDQFAAGEGGAEGGW